MLFQEPETDLELYDNRLHQASSECVEAVSRLPAGHTVL